MDTSTLTPSATITLAEARSEHVPAMLDIYAVYVLTALCTFEEVPPSLAEMHRRLDRLRRAGLPWLVALEGKEVVGYAYAGPYRTRSAYNGTVESSIYVSNRHHGKGLGKLLMNALVEQCRAQGYSQMVAVIGDSGNLASIALHRKAGFQHIGTLTKVGRKFNCLVDTVLMQLSLKPE